MKKSFQKDLQFLLKSKWKLIDANTIQSPDGSIISKDIEKIARVWRAKLKISKMIDRRISNRDLRRHLTKETIWNKLYHALRFILSKPH